MKTFPGGTHLVMESSNDDGSKMYAIGYKYSSKKVLCFICSEGTGSTKCGKPYAARWTDCHSNVHSQKNPCPYNISQYFSFCNIIDCHNQAQQFELALEKKWVTQNPYFCLDITIFGVGVTDCWKGYRWNLNAKHGDKKMGITDYSNILSLECLENTFPNTRTED